MAAAKALEPPSVTRPPVEAVPHAAPVGPGSIEPAEPVRAVGRLEDPASPTAKGMTEIGHTPGREPEVCQLIPPREPDGS